jgi:hypothetical protein
MRERARVRRRERELGQRRERAISENREVADAHASRAEVAELRARIAAEDARHERAAAQVRRERAGLHERGLADDELVEDHERGANAAA